MKKTLIILIFIISFYIFVSSVGSKVLIPNEAIRIRIIANSNSVNDQNIKKQVKNSVENDVYYLLKDAKTIEETRSIINHNLDKIDISVKKALSYLNDKTKYNVNFGYNYFPDKTFKGIKYKEGFYESLVVTLGEGQGDNWWCVLFPPLCLLEAEESTNVEYKSYVKEILDKYF
ncbi:MAG: stage II sporulation protein R [Bacilli bacterium]